jgi:hypothetical protein
VRPLGLTAGLSYCDGRPEGKEMRTKIAPTEAPTAHQPSKLLRSQMYSGKSLPSKAGISWIALGGCPA